MNQIRASTVITLAVVALCFRLMPYALYALGIPIDPASASYPWNFSPILPLAVFGAACYASRGIACLVPLGIYLASDLGIWLITGRIDWAFHSAQPGLYLAVVLVVASGLWLRTGRTWLKVAATGFGAGCVFFAVSNLGVWLAGDGVRYPHTLAGLIDCYVQAIPFFRNSLVSMAVFLPLLFSRVTVRRPTMLPSGQESAIARAG